MIRIICLVICVLFPISLFGQAGKDCPDLWTFNEHREVHKAIVLIEGKTSRCQGTGTVIKLIDDIEKGSHCWIITAAHVCDCDDEFIIKYSDGTIFSGAKKKAELPKADCIPAAIDGVILYGWCPDGIPALKIAKELPKEGSEVEVCGHGAIRGLRVWTAKVGLADCEIVCVFAWIIPGDSGGPVLNSNNEIVSIISGGFGTCQRHLVIDADKGESTQLQIWMTAPLWGIGLNGLNKLERIASE